MQFYPSRKYRYLLRKNGIRRTDPDQKLMPKPDDEDLKKIIRVHNAAVH
jgi:hypothetical protein